MKTFFKLLFAFSLGLAIAGCAKYDDTELRGKVDSLTSDVNTLKANQQAMQAVIDVWKAGGYVASIDNSVPGQHTITFYGDNGKTVVIYDGTDGEDGADGDTFFKDVTSDENGVTFEKQDGTKIFIPFAKAFKLVIETPEAEVEAGAKVEFAYKVENANSTTSVDVFAGGNYAAVVDAEASKIVVTAPAPAVNGSVLAWAQNEEGLFSMRKLSFTVKSELEIKTKQEEYQAIPADAGDFVVDVVSNIDIEVEKPTVDWVTVAVTKADYKLTLTLAENTTEKPREATINILRSDNKKQVQSIKIIQLAPVKKVLTLERKWGWYSSADALWTTKMTAISISHPDGYGMARALAMDDNYIYLPKSSGYAAIGAVQIADATKQVKGDVTGISGGTTFVTSFARVIKNTSETVNGGKDILLVCNLTETNSDANKLQVYAYENGIEAAPKMIAAFCWDSANNVNDWRRYGDRFFVTGTYQDGKLYFPSFNPNKTVVLSIANGARTAVTQIAAGAENSPSGIKDVTVYPGDSKLFFTNIEIANQVASTGGKSNGWDEYSLSASSEKGKGTFGYNFFEFNKNKYIAYARIDGKKAWVEVIADKGDLLKSLSEQEGLMKSSIHDAAKLDAEFATGNLADCCVRVVKDTAYIAALTRDGGLIVDKLYMKAVESSDPK